jgi:hypothetical protein
MGLRKRIMRGYKCYNVKDREIRIVILQSLCYLRAILGGVNRRGKYKSRSISIWKSRYIQRIII